MIQNWKHLKNCNKKLMGCMMKWWAVPQHRQLSHLLLMWRPGFAPMESRMICGGQSSTGTGFFWVLVFPVNILPLLPHIPPWIMWGDKQQTFNKLPGNVNRYVVALCHDYFVYTIQSFPLAVPPPHNCGTNRCISIKLLMNSMPLEVTLPLYLPAHSTAAQPMVTYIWFWVLASYQQ